MKKIYLSPMIEVSKVRPLYSFLANSKEIGVIDDGYAKERNTDEFVDNTNSQEWGEELQKSIW
ncbi:MAG: hypothetical protein J6T52_10625 [Bacteroidaceae bacterium]|nr:hypothetical protein [Bacteroidaceae bacterium]